MAQSPGPFELPPNMVLHSRPPHPAGLLAARCEERPEVVERWREEFFHALDITADATAPEHLISVLEMELKVSTSNIGSEVVMAMSNVISGEGDRGEICDRRLARAWPHIHTIVLEGELNRLHDVRIATW